ncbi:MAG: putative motility protein [Syntrophorhabdaceae bacterium]
MMDAISSVMSFMMMRENLTVSLVKSRMDAESAAIEMFMEAARTIERITESSLPHRGSNIDICV